MTIPVGTIAPDVALVPPTGLLLEGELLEEPEEDPELDPEEEPG